MSIQCVAWVLESSEATGSCRLVLLSIANHASAEGFNAYPSVDTIGKEARLSRATVFRALDELQAAGLVRVEHGAGGDEKCPANRRPNRYTVLGMGSQNETGQTGLGSQESALGVSSDSSRGLTGETQTVLPEPSLQTFIARFDEFWAEYPRKVEKKTARDCWKRAVKRAHPDLILAGLRRAIPGWKAKNFEFVPNPTTWLNRDRWEDELAPDPMPADQKPDPPRPELEDAAAIKARDLEAKERSAPPPPGLRPGARPEQEVNAL